MDVFFKKYFWTVNLVVIAICAAFAGRAAAHLFEGAYLVSDEGAPTTRRSTYVPPPRAHGKETEQIIKRDVFCSGCAPIVASAPSGEGPTSNEPQKTSLPLELVSTLVCPDDDHWSVAIVRDLSTKEKDPLMVHRGSRVTSETLVAQVISKRVYLRNGGRLEYLDLEGGTPATAAATPPVASAPIALGGSFDANQGDIDRGVTCSGNNCTVDRSLVEKMLSNTTMLATAARFVPSQKDGKPNGFRLFAIRPNSIFGKLNLQNGDTIKAINGQEMNTPDAALALYSKLRNASHLSVQVERRGETVTMDYTIR